MDLRGFRDCPLPVSSLLMLMQQVLEPHFGTRGLVHVRSREREQCCANHTGAVLATLSPGSSPSPGVGMNFGSGFEPLPLIGTLTFDILSTNGANIVSTQGGAEDKAGSTSLALTLCSFSPFQQYAQIQSPHQDN